MVPDGCPGLKIEPGEAENVPAATSARFDVFVAIFLEICCINA
jgi:hypothetical protein